MKKLFFFLFLFHCLDFLEAQVLQDLIPPQMIAYNPENNGLLSNPDFPFQITFDEPVLKVAGTISVFQNSVLIQQIDINAPEVIVDVANVRFTLTGILSESNLRIEIPSGVISDLSGNAWAGTGIPSDWNCNTTCFQIACFSSIFPTNQTTNFRLPDSHAFQVIVQKGAPYTNGGVFPDNFDFTGYVATDGSSRNGKISLNHETTPVAAVTIMDVNYSPTTQLWEVLNSSPIDFSAVVKTQRNCSGGLTPWGTVLIGEEMKIIGDTNLDGYDDVGWFVEIDPLLRQVKDYGNGQQKLWPMGRMRHENAAVSYADSRTVYFGEDDTTGCLYKFIANEAENLSQGLLYVLKMDSPLNSGNPQSATGVWMLVPNGSITERNSTYLLASQLAATIFNGIEDVEIGPDGMIYFTSKAHGRIYRFTDNGNSVSGFETFVGGRSYDIDINGTPITENWSIGNDNLAFDDEGNLWVLQDGGRNFIWVVKAGHTQVNPLVSIFGQVPIGAEPTGITFTPDKRFLFMSIQHPADTNTNQLDATGNFITINKSSMIVIARKEFLGIPETPLITTTLDDHGIDVFPNPFSDEMNIDFRNAQEKLRTIELIDLSGKLIRVEQIPVGTKNYQFKLKMEGLKGMFFLRLISEKGCYTKKIVSE